jgi:hypothetical protein
VKELQVLEVEEVEMFVLFFPQSKQVVFLFWGLTLVKDIK